MKNAARSPCRLRPPRSLGATALLVSFLSAPGLHAEPPSTPKSPSSTPLSPSGPSSSAPSPQASPTQASPPQAPLAPADRATLQTLLERADHAVETGELKTAHAALQSAYALKPSRATACDLGLVARGLELWDEAVEYLSRCTAGAPPTFANTARYAGLRAQLDVARKELDAPAPLSQSAPDPASARAPALVPPSSPAPLVAPIPAPLPPPPPTLQTDRRVIAGSAILAGASALVGSVFLGVAQAHFNNAQSAMRQNPAACLQGSSGVDACRDLRDLYSSGNAFRDYAAVSFLSSGLSLVATAALALSPVTVMPAVKTSRGVTLEFVW